MKRRISFFNLHQYGDFYHTRGMIDWIVKHINTDEIETNFFYNRAGQLDLVDNVKCINLRDTKSFWPIYDFSYLCFVNPETSDQELVINTWIASYPEFPRFDPNRPVFPFYDAWKYINAETIKNQTSFIINIINHFFRLNVPHPTRVEDIIPSVPTSLPNKKQTDELLRITDAYRKKILICNGPVLSGQTRYDFDVSDRIQPVVEQNPDCAFIYTEKIDTPLPNEFVIDNYIDRPNLNEIVYFSTFCDVLISRMSGPGCAICVDKNFFNPNLSFICLTELADLAHWYRGGSCKYIWSNNYDKENISFLLNNEIRGV